MPKRRKPSDRQKQLDFDYVERNRWVKLRLLEELPACEKVKHVLFTLDRFARNKEWCGIGYGPSMAKIALHMGVSDRTASRRLNQAADAGWIEVKRIPGRSSNYRICWGKVFEESEANIQNEVIAAQERIESGQDAEVEMERKQQEQREKNQQQQKLRDSAPKPKRQRGKLANGFPEGYSPYGPATEPKRATIQDQPKTLTVSRTTKRKGKRWNCHLDSHVFRDASQIQQMFERAAELGLVKNTDRMRGEVWALAVHCRKAANPGAMFRTNIESEAPFSSVTEKNEIQAQKEMLDYDRLSDVFSETLDEAFAEVT